MALLDVSELLVDPDFATTFNVIRRAEGVGSNGRVSITEERFDNQVGVIIDTDPADLDIRDDGQTKPRVVTIATQFRLRGLAPGFQPDEVEVEGERLRVIKVISHARWGAGFVKAVAQTITTPPAAP